MKNLTIKEIEEKLQNCEMSKELCVSLNIFLNAIQDWPTEILTLCNYENVVEAFIDNKTTKANIENSLKHIDFHAHAWEAESLIQILEIFQFYKEEHSLKEIIVHIEEQL